MTVACIFHIFHLTSIELGTGDVHTNLSCDYEFHENRRSESCSLLVSV